MSDILFPPDLVPNTMMFGIDDFTAVDESATTGGMQSSALYGTRRWHLRMDFAVLSRKSGSLARFEGLTAALRGRANRVWISPAQAAVRRGSFPAVEIFANNDFSSGVAGWVTDASAQYSISAIDHGIRATRIKVTAASFAIAQGTALTLNTPYAIRGFINSGKGNSANITVGESGTGKAFGFIPQGMMEGAFTEPSNTTPECGFFDFSTSPAVAGDYVDAKWASLSRCAQVDNGVNLLMNSDTPGSGTGWSLAAATAATASAVGPDGATDAWGLTETATTAQHVARQDLAVSTAAADYTVSIFGKAANRTFCYIQISDGVNTILQWFNLSTGATGTFTGATNFTLIGALSVDYGNGWKRCVLSFRKSSSSTTLSCIYGAATADAVFSYLGVASLSIQTWRASTAQSSVPVQPIQTAATAQTGTLQTGYLLNLKGLPVSTQGLLLEGDVVECLMPVNSQLLRVTSRLDSDGAGLGTLIFENALKQSPVDGAGVVVQQPMGRFVLAASTLGIEYTPGVFGQASLEFIEAA